MMLTGSTVSQQSQNIPETGAGIQRDITNVITTTINNMYGPRMVATWT
jgi:hypothetical protein